MSDHPPLQWKTHAGLGDYDEYYAKIAEKKKFNRVKKRYFQSLYYGGTGGASNPKRKWSSSSEEDQEVPKKSRAASKEPIFSIPPFPQRKKATATKTSVQESGRSLQVHCSASEDENEIPDLEVETEEPKKSTVASTESKVSFPQRKKDTARKTSGQESVNGRSLQVQCSPANDTLREQLKQATFNSKSASNSSLKSIKKDSERFTLSSTKQTTSNSKSASNSSLKSNKNGSKEFTLPATKHTPSRTRAPRTQSEVTTPRRPPQGINVNGSNSVFTLPSTESKSKSLVDRQYEKRIAELEGANAKLKNREEELLKENAKMSSSYEKVKSIRMLLAAKVKVANPEEDQEELCNLSLGQLVCRYESVVVPLTTSSSNKKEIERLTKKVEKLEAKKKSLRGKLVAAKTGNDLQSMKEDIIKAVNKDCGDTKKFQDEIASMKETISELETKKKLQYAMNEAQQSQESKLKKILGMPEESALYMVVEKVKEMKETLSGLYEENGVFNEFL